MAERNTHGIVRMRPERAPEIVEIPCGTSSAWSALVRDDGRRWGKGSKVILAHDDAAVRLVLAQVLRRDGHEVREVSTGSEVTNELATATVEGRSPPDLLIASDRLRGLTGLELIGGLRGTPWEVPTILVVRSGDIAARHHGRRLGATMVMEWPFELDDFRTVALHLARGRFTHVLAQRS